MSLTQGSRREFLEAHDLDLDLGGGYVNLQMG